MSEPEKILTATCERLRPVAVLASSSCPAGLLPLSRQMPRPLQTKSSSVRKTKKTTFHRAPDSPRQKTQSIRIF